MNRITDNLAFASWSIVGQSPHQMPFDLAILPEMELRRAISGFKVARLSYLAYVFLIGLVLDSVLREGFLTEFYRHVFFGELDAGFLACQPQLAIESPMAFR